MLWLLSITVGLYVLAAAAEYLLALHAASGAYVVPIRARSTRRGLS